MFTDVACTHTHTHTHTPSLSFVCWAVQCRVHPSQNTATAERKGERKRQGYREGRRTKINRKKEETKEFELYTIKKGMLQHNITPKVFT